MKIKFSIRKEIRIVAGLALVFFLIAFSERKQGAILCRNVLVEMVNSTDNYFLDEADVNLLVENSGQKLRGAAIGRIDFKAIEKILISDRHIKDAELFGDLKGNLIVRVDMRRCVARIVQADAPDAYVAEDGVIMGVSDKFSARVMIISGKFTKRLVETGDLSKSDDGALFFEMIRFIAADPFWRAQVAQLDIAGDGDITIYPQVTGQLVEFGKPENYAVKFRKLMVFYKEILPQKGWTKYERVNLNYEGQVIAQ